MVNWLKYLWEESGKKSFLIRFIVPAAGLYFTWGFIGHLYISNVQLEDLTPVKGRIGFIGVVSEKSISQSGGTYHPLKIRLDKGSELYRLQDEFRFRFDELIDELDNGDLITIYKRNRIQAVLTWGKENDIFQIDVDGSTLFKLEWMLNYKKNQMTAFGIFALICWVVYGCYRIDYMRKKKGPLAKAKNP